MRGGVDSKLNVSCQVSTVFKIEAVLAGAMRINGERIDVRTMKRVSGEELVFWIIVLRLHIQHRRATYDQECHEH
jgi:hypothetical protein